jgi:hypothetical protein
LVRGGDERVVECGESLRTIERPLRVLLFSLWWDIGVGGDEMLIFGCMNWIL